MKVYKTKTSKQTINLGQELGKTIQKGSFIALYGDLGSGKTTFVQGIAKGLGIQQRLVSPTFIILRSYAMEDKKGKISNFYHVDLYRINGEKDIEGIGLDQIIKNDNDIIAVEWAEKIKYILPKKRIDVFFEGKETEHIIKIKKN